MEAEEHRRYTDDLRRRLEGDVRVLGLVALGSTSGLEPPPDRHSDHDFFVITRAGAQESFRNDLSWLPGADRIVLAFRETAHGCKVVFDDGHLVEFAVFEPDEIPVARVNRYRVLFDRESIEERVAAVAAATKERAESARPSAEWLAGQFLTSLLVGAERDLRGERLSGRELVKDRAVRHLIGLFEADGRESPHAVDSLDPLRRFEQAFRNRGERINAILEEPTPLAARLLLDLAVAELPGRLPPRAVDAVRRRLSD